ncbi:MAG: hypothetical protein SFW36_06455 [Leptolyngbyaceae cyanobacterium bins.59]|nr:hypothetical protein [Leptolyngbyaceae cyanobacterium bins.59]
MTKRKRKRVRGNEFWDRDKDIRLRKRKEPKKNLIAFLKPPNINKNLLLNIFQLSLNILKSLKNIQDTILKYKDLVKDKIEKVNKFLNNPWIQGVIQIINLTKAVNFLINLIFFLINSVS